MITDNELKELQERNEVRLVKFKEEMGIRYLLHPENKVKKIVVKKRRNKKHV